MNYEIIVVALIAGIPGTLSALSSRRNSRKIDNTQSQLDGRLTQILELARREARAQGLIDGAANEVRAERKRRDEASGD